MSDTYAFAIEGLDDLAKFQDLPEKIELAAQRAINKTVVSTRKDSADRIRLQVNFAAQYLTGPDGRLPITKFAKPGALEAVITGRHRPTSLARFTTGSVNKKTGVQVEVKPGRVRFMRRAFLMRLRAGAGITDTRFNLGLALRLRPGESVQNKRDMVRISGNLYLLYGPSVDQVFRTVAEDVSPSAADRLESEFLRLLDLDLK
jgi:hypothetical protein